MKRFARQQSILRKTAGALAVLLFLESALPTAAFALTGGPSQPEVQGFTPIGTSDMVDLFSGDFSYNIPLIDMDGYPLNLAYQSGIGMDQEASWVGLGWNLNPGVINRNMRGLPDDFNGDSIRKIMNMKPNTTFGINAGFGAEFFGMDNTNLNYTLGISFNNYNGLGIDQSFNFSLQAPDKAKVPYTMGLGLNSSSENGLTISPQVGLSSLASEKAGADWAAAKALGITVGASFNSRGGLKQLTVNSDLNRKFISNPIMASAAASGFGTSSTFNFGSYHYSPSIQLPMYNYSVNASFKFGGEFAGIHGTYNMSGYLSSQRLAQQEQYSPAYGYMNMDNGSSQAHSVLDFNRENDRSMVTNLPAIGLTALTYDTYGVSGQGVGGSYRALRSDIGFVFDPLQQTYADGGNIGAEMGAGNLARNGLDMGQNVSLSVSGKWNDGNNAQSKLTYKGNGANPDYEKWYFKEANEKSVEADPAYQQIAAQSKAHQFVIENDGLFNKKLSDKVADKNGAVTTLPASNTRTQRDQRNQVIHSLSRQEVNLGMGLTAPHPSAYNAPKHHIAEITTYGTDGMRYVYGIPLYNTYQKEVTFAVGAKLYGGSGRTGNCTTGQVTYQTNSGEEDNSVNNKLGIDNYYNAEIIPPYAHSYLLTSVLSPDYIDADQVKGPSSGDLGYYTQFYYHPQTNYKWRTPVGNKQANWNEGLKCDPNDDKASYIYGEKELWYMDSIVSKNYIAIFHTEERKDGWGVANEDGALNTTAGQGMRLLRKISLYSLHDYRANGVNAVPIKEVHFEYDYSLCPNAPNNNGVAEMVNSVNINQAQGKLTLKKVYFTYRNSNKGKLSSYSFTYSSNNPSYHLKGYDRWGNYKAPGGSCTPSSVGLTNAEFPYVDQNQTTADQYASSWSLVQIKLPSGGKINVDYESDDYAYVQHKRAMQMFKVVGVQGSIGNSISSVETATELSHSSAGNYNKKLIVELTPGYTLDQYLDGIDQLYFRFLMNFNTSSSGNDYDYVSGYATIDKANSAMAGINSTAGNPLAYIALKGVKLNDNGVNYYNPIVKAAIQFGRMNLPRLVWGTPGLNGDESFGQDVLASMIASNPVANLISAIQGPNLSIYNEGRGRHFMSHKSWVRLNNPNMKKLGGGCRVKKIRLSDEFSVFTGGAMAGAEYGQEYFYTLEDGSSSGVALYEPQLGGDENPWKQPIFFSEEHLLAPDDQHYLEEPLGESFFPGASVGYSRVTVKNLQHNNVTRTATGKVVHEFFTAKDFPTIVDRTKLDAQQDKSDPFSITSMLYTNTRDYMTASQGFYIELNDMHGKQKRQRVYQEGRDEPITDVEYFYASDPYLQESKRLKSTATVIDRNGNVNTASIGVFTDMAGDMREFKSDNKAIAVQLNLDMFAIPPIPFIAIPTILPKLSRDRTQYRSATLTKVIQRFGILERVVARDLGSVVETHNLAYDAHTGALLLTSVTTNFDDRVYNLTIPAHWYYDGMGQAYRNLGLTNTLTVTAGVASVNQAAKYYVPGDELVMTNANGTLRGWVLEVTPNSIILVDRSGNYMSGTYLTKIIRSGRRNLSETPISTVTSLTNPLNTIKNNVYAQVLQAGASEFTDQWRTFCDCFTLNSADPDYTTNPYVLGIKGVWKMKRAWLHLSPRDQSNYNNNSNIRKDGTFTSFRPFYRYGSGKWNIDERDWTYTAEVTEFSPYGQELENRDALGRYSAATFGYRQTLPTGVAANARYRDIGTDNFEDYGFSPCADNHFKFPIPSSAIYNLSSHSGRKSLKVSAGSPVTMEKTLTVCAPAGCALTLSSSTTSGQIDVTINNGSGPYTIDWNVLQGSTTNVDISGTTITATGTGLTIEVIVVDANGCKASIIVSN